MDWTQGVKMDTEFERFELEFIPARLLKESNRAQETAQKLINETALRINGLRQELSRVKAQEEELNKRIESLQKQMMEEKDNAEEQYNKTITAIVEMLGVKPPFEATIEVSEDGEPVALGIKKPSVVNSKAEDTGSDSKESLKDEAGDSED